MFVHCLYCLHVPLGNQGWLRVRRGENKEAKEYIILPAVINKMF
jgi:hypothetical protein